MQIKSLILIASLLASTAAFAGFTSPIADNWVSVTVPVQGTNSERQVRLLLPGGFNLYNANKTFPTIYIVGQTNESAVQRSLEEVISAGQWKEPKIIVDTQINDSSPENLDFLANDLIPWMEKSKNADPQNRILLESNSVNEPISAKIQEQVPNTFSTIQFNSQPKPVTANSLSKLDRGLYWGSVAALAGSQVCDIISSQPLVINGVNQIEEQNPHFRNSNGQFGARGYEIKGAVFGGLVAAEILTRHLLKNKSLKTQRIFNTAFAVGNSAIAANTFLVCKENLDLRHEIEKSAIPTN